jgi:hypothetical protein
MCCHAFASHHKHVCIVHNDAREHSSLGDLRAQVPASAAPLLLITMKVDRGENLGSACAPAREYREGATKLEATRDEHCGAITCTEWGRSNQLTLGKNRVVVESENADSTVIRPYAPRHTHDRSASKRRLNTVPLAGIALQEGAAGCERRRRGASGGY